MYYDFVQRVTVRAIPYVVSVFHLYSSNVRPIVEVLVFPSVTAKFNSDNDRSLQEKTLVPRVDLETIVVGNHDNCDTTPWQDDEQEHK